MAVVATITSANASQVIRVRVHLKEINFYLFCEFLLIFEDDAYLV